MNDQQRLGNKGEQRFGELCSDAGLTYNKSTLDLAGWDFIVNWNIDDTQSLHLDRRRTPLSCYVQVKTTWDTTKPVRLKLNMAERLGLEAIPSFICVFRVNRKLQFTDAFVIHISGSRLASILKRLRKAQAEKDGVPLDKKFIAFTPGDGERIELTGAALRDAFVSHIGADFHRYIEEKRAQREKLGFKERPISMSMVFENLSESEILDAFLGIKGQVPVSNFEVVETRFDIPLSEGGPSSAKITIEPNPSDSCTLTVRRGKRGLPTVFEGKVFVAPKIGGTQRILIKSDLFVFLVDRDRKFGRGKARFEFSIEGKRCTALVWADYWRMLSAFRSGEGMIEIKLESIAVPWELDINIDESTGVEGQIAPDDCVRILECLSNILSHVGVRPEPTFEYGEIFAEANRILVLSAMLETQSSTITVHDLSEDVLDELPLGRTVVANTLSVGATIFCFYATATVEKGIDTEGRPVVFFHDFLPKRVRIIEAGEENVKSFVERAQRSEEIDQVIWL